VPFFAVLGESGVKVSLLTCHINLWALPGLLRPHFYCDVGLKFRVHGGRPIQQLRVLLPFGTSPDGFSDLSPAMRHPDVSRLVFGEPVSVSENAVLSYRDQRLQLLAVSGRSSPVTAGSGRTIESLWTLDLAQPATTGTTYYVRFRFLMTDLGATWLWQRGLVFKRIGSKVDFRVSDVRETSTTLGSNESSILPIEDLYLFVIAPWSLQARSISPALRYMRVLEGTAWIRYLETAIRPRSSTRLVVYYWRMRSGAVQLNLSPGVEIASSDASVNPQNPFRAFLGLSREYGPTVLVNQFAILVLVIIGVSVAASATADLGAALGWLSRTVPASWPGIIALLGIVGLSAFLVGVRRSIRWADETTRRLDRALARALGPNP